METAEDKDNMQLKRKGMKNKNLLSHFYDLAAVKQHLRIKSVFEIMGQLKENHSEDEIEYTLQRLVKGLASSRIAARQGYATALAQLIIEFDDVSADIVFKSITKNLTVTGSFKGQDERDNYFGQLFGMIAIWKSQSISSNSMDGIVIKTLITKLLELGSKKSFLQEVCGKAVCDIMQEIDFEMYDKFVAEELNNVLTCGWEKCTPEYIMIILTIMRKFKNELPSKYLKEHWGKSDLLHPSNFKKMLPPLMETTNLSHPRTHLVFSLIFQQILHEDDFERFEKFWKAVVIDGLLQSTHARKYLAINLLLDVAGDIPPEKIDLVLNEDMLKCLINSSQSKENYLCKAVKSVLEKLPGILSKNRHENIVPITIKTLVGRYGNFNFDGITKTRVVEKLTSMIITDLKEYMDFLYKTFATGFIKGNDITGKSNKERKEMIQQCRCWAANQFAIIVKSQKNAANEDLFVEAALFLFVHANFKIIKKLKKYNIIAHDISEPLSEKTKTVCKQKFNTILNELSHLMLKPAKSENVHPIIPGMGTDDQLYVTKILYKVNDFLNLPKYVVLENTWMPETYEIFNSSLDLIKRYSSTDKQGTNTRNKELLLAHATIQLFDDSAEATPVLNDLITCIEKSEAKKKKNCSEPHWTEVLTEILLGFLAQSSGLMRQVVDLVFPTLLPHITPEAFQMLLDAIKPKSKLEDEGVTMGEGSEDENMCDEELTKENGSGDVNSDSDETDNLENKEDSEEDDESSDDNKSEDEGIEIDEGLKSKLESSLADDVKEDGSEVDEGDLDMDTCDPNILKAYDKKLSSIFEARKAMKEEKKMKKLQKESIQHYKLRVLDLIEIMIKKFPKHERVVDLLIPLFEIIKSTNGQSKEESYHLRTLGIFQKLVQLHVYPALNENMADSIHNNIEEMLQYSKQALPSSLDSLLVFGICYLIRVLRGSSHEEISPRKTRNQRKRKTNDNVEKKEPTKSFVDVEKLTEYFSSAMHEFMTVKSTHLRPILFMEYFKRFPDLAWQLSPNLTQYYWKSCKAFRKMKAVELTKHLLSKKIFIEKPLLEEFKVNFFLDISKLIENASNEKCAIKCQHYNNVMSVIEMFIKHLKHYEISWADCSEALTNSLETAINTPVFNRSQSLVTRSKKLKASLNEGNEDMPTKKKKKKDKSRKSKD